MCVGGFGGGGGIEQRERMCMEQSRDLNVCGCIKRGCVCECIKRERMCMYVCMCVCMCVLREGVYVCIERGGVCVY